MKQTTPAEFPVRLARFPRLGLAHLPTPLEPLERLTAHVGGPRLWVKREDLTGVGFGGNKLRKLDYVLHDAVASGADALVSGGVVQSNSQRQVAAAAAKLGLECHLVVYHGRVEPPSPEYERSGNALLNRLYGAILHDVPWTGDRNAAIRSLADELASEGRKPFVVPYGVSSPMGAVGYASAAVEIADQCVAHEISPAAIVHCSGSAGTQAGLIVGAMELLPSTRVVGIDIDAEPERVRADVVTYAAAAAELLDTPFSDDCVEVVAGHAGPAYGVPHE
ncbi:MAG: pyridoxal-phosphate dependent enzyme, partial [Pseudomonadota bacterium]